MAAMEGIERKDLPSGARYLKVHHYADPSKDDVWLAAVKQEMRDTPRDYRREILMDDTVHDGDPVFPDYSKARNEYPGEIRILEESLLIGGWDCGTARQPAFVLAQVTPKTWQVQFLFEVVPDKGMAMETFAPIVKDELRKRIPGRWSDVFHCGDQTVKTKSGAREVSAWDVAKEHGFVIKPVSNAIDPREQAVIWGLTDFCDDGETLARFVYSRKGCPVLTEGMRGAYCMKPKPSGDAHGPGLIVAAPAKNFFSHVNDAHQYIAVYVRQLILNRHNELTKLKNRPKAPSATSGRITADMLFDGPKPKFGSRRPVLPER